MIEVPRNLMGELLDHASTEYPNEACGLLAGSLDGAGSSLKATSEIFFPMRNADASPASYRLDPKEQLQVFEEIDDKGLELVGICHSHTHSEAYPSETDRRLAFYPEAHYLLVSLEDRAKPVVRGFTIREGEVEEEEVRVS